MYRGTTRRLRGSKKEAVGTYRCIRLGFAYLFIGRSYMVVQTLQALFAVRGARLFLLANSSEAQQAMGTQC